MLAPPLAPGTLKAPFVPSGASQSEGGRKSGPMRYWWAISRACLRSSGVKSMRSFSVIPWISKAAGLVGNGWVGQVFSSGASDCGTLRSSMGQTGSPVSRLKT